MERTYFTDNQYEKINFAESAFPVGDYENCRFINCNFLNVALSGVRFSECEFSGCNLGMAKLIKTALKDIRFKSSKLLGLHFENCDQFLFLASFDECSLRLASFYQMKLARIRFINCDLQEVDFTEADLNNSVFSNCDLSGAIFDNTNLEKADLRTSFNYSINPQSNKIKRAKFSLEGVVGLLDKFDIEIEN